MTVKSNGSRESKDLEKAGSLVTVEGHSGRRFLILAGFGLFILWGILFFLFRDWRFHYRERAKYGLLEVAPQIDKLYYVEIPDNVIHSDDWRDAVDRTHAMLDTVVTANLLDLNQLKALRAELERRVARAKARPETASEELAAIWDSMADRAEFLLTEKDRHPRPAILPHRRDRRTSK